MAISGLAPYGSAGLDWFAGMAPAGVASLTAATRGREAKEAFEADPPEEPDIGFMPGDWAALSGDWAWMIEVVRARSAAEAAARWTTTWPPSDRGASTRRT